MNAELRKILLDIADWLDTELRETGLGRPSGVMAAAEVALRIVAAGLVEEERDAR
jgi:hypothetical protein